jgi:hypothetical protein
MMKVEGLSVQAGTGSWLGRLPFVSLLTVGLLLSLLHCAGCGLEFAKSDSTIVVMNTDFGSAPDTPEQQMPGHSGHCLSHVGAQAIAAVALPADPVPRTPAFGQEQSRAKLAGLPLFKPPRT